MAGDDLAEAGDSIDIEEEMELGSTLISENVGYVWIDDQIAFTLGTFSRISPFDEIPIATNTFNVAKAQTSSDEMEIFNFEDIWADDQYATALGSGIATNTINIEVIQE